MTPSRDVLKSIANLDHNRDWQRVVEWLSQEHTKAAVDSTHIGGQEGEWVKGQAQALEMLCARIATAPERLQEMEVENEKPKGPIV